MPSKLVALWVLISVATLFTLWGFTATWMPPIVQELPLEEFSQRHLWTPILGEPSLVWVGVPGVALFVGAWLVAGRRAVSHTFATLASVMFLLLGLWLPVASRLWCWAMTAWSDYLDADFRLAQPLALAGWVLVPPVVAAILITHFQARLSRRAIHMGLAIGIVCAIASRYGAAVASTRCIGRVPTVECPSLVFVSFVHVFLAIGFVACVSLLGLVLSRRTTSLETTHACKRYLVFLILVSIPNVIAIEQSFRLVDYVSWWMRRL